MRITLVTNWIDRKGLWRDGCIVEALLLSWGHHPVRVQYTDAKHAPLADLNIFLETLRPDVFPRAPLNWWMPNPEWAGPADLAALPNVDRVVCKTREAERLFAPLTDRAVYTGFESEDRYDPTVPRETKVLHVAGGSILKGTQAVLDAWEQYHLPYLLTVIGDEQVVKPRPIPNVTYLKWVEDAELKRLQNSHSVHLQPSETEGWGHTIWEGLSVNARVLTTDQEIPVAPWLQGEVHGVRCLSPLIRVKSETIAFKVGHEFAMTDLQEPSPRSYFLKDREQFRARLKALVDDHV